MKEAFTAIAFQARTLAVIEQANVIISEYAAQGFTMSLRQLYYPRAVGPGGEELGQGQKAVQS